MADENEKRFLFGRADARGVCLPAAARSVSHKNEKPDARWSVPRARSFAEPLVFSTRSFVRAKNRWLRYTVLGDGRDMVEDRGNEWREMEIGAWNFGNFFEEGRSKEKKCKDLKKILNIKASQNWEKENVFIFNIKINSVALAFPTAYFFVTPNSIKYS